MPKSVCLNYHIKQCVGPCAGKISDSGYGEIVAELKLFLEGGKAGLLKVLSKKMTEASEEEDFEKAAELKERIEALSTIKADSVSYKPAGELEELRKLLGSSRMIDTIEAFDVSNIMGEEAVGSMVCFYKGRPRKSHYRKFKISTIPGPDDYAMMREIVGRRYSRISGNKDNVPDLVVIDGGKGHLSVAVETLEKFGFGDIPVVGIAKEFEHIYVKGRKAPIVLPKESKALHLLQRIRDEAHRFAISYHKALMSKRVEVSELDGISGIGAKRKRALINSFGSIEAVKNAALEELLRVRGIHEKVARGIIGHFKGLKA